MRDTSSGRQSNSECWRAGVCLALIVLLLYNPFLTILGSSQNISVRHVLSYRATVASSELRRCMLEPAQPPLPELTTVIFFAAFLLETGDETLAAQPRDASVPVSLASCDNVWFRPPPSV